MSNDLNEKLQQAFGRFTARDLAGTERLCVEILRAVPQHPDALHLLGVVHMVSGKPREAVSFINRALKVAPRDAAMQENLGMARAALGDFRAAEAAFRQALALGASHAQLHMRLGLALGAQGKRADAVSALRAAAGLSPGDADVQLNLGNALAESGQGEEALGCYRKVLALRPDYAPAHFNLGSLLRNMGRLEEAEPSFRQALAAAPGDPDIHNNLGLLYERQGRFEDAESSYWQALARDPGHVHSRNNLGNVLRKQARLDEAVACFEIVLSQAPDHVDAHINLGNARADQGRHSDARTHYEKALRLEPRNFEAHCNLGGLLKLQGRVAEAIAHYRRALAIDPKQALAHRGLGAAHRQAGDLDSAVACFQTANELDPGHADTQFDLAETFKLQGRLDSAVASYERALALNPDHSLALGGLIYLRQHMCDWDGIDGLWQRLRGAVMGKAGAAVSPFSFLYMPFAADEQLVCARQWARQMLGHLEAARSGLGLGDPPRRRHPRTRIGYLSWDFHQHATSYLMAELFELHDRSRFEIFAYSYGPDDGSPIRARISSACEHFVDVASESFVETAQRIRRDGIDILVDLKGYTMGSRPEILALRPAPIQVNWLGYPGSMGPACVDYLLADSFIVPEGAERHYSERVVRLPGCYQVNDRKREIDERMPDRCENGLPASGVVLCCFNLSAKILPDVFDAWMRIMRAVPESVLWLLETNRWAVENLRRAAADHGIAPDRLVFAPHRPVSEHLARYRLADLSIDTFPYTSHTTASDALWASCPLVTRVGETFASRVAGSILRNAGLPELVTDSLAQYERLVIELATNPEKLQAVRRKLQENRDSCPLFDTPRFVRNLESAYEEMATIR